MTTITGEAGWVSEMLVEYAATRDVELRNVLVVRHLPLVKFVARKMSSNLPENVELDDLVSWGSIGLIDAIEKFEPQRGLQFSTYAVTRIRGEILDGLQRMEWAPKQITSQVRKFKRAVEKLQHELNCAPTDEQLAVELEIDAGAVRSIRVDMYATHSFRHLSPARTDAEEGQPGSDSVLMEEADQELAGEVGEIRSRMADALVGTIGQDAKILHLYYGRNLTLREIAAELGISVSSATQAHTRLVDRVRRRLAERHGCVA